MKDPLKWQKHAMRIALAAMENSEDIYQKVGACILAPDHSVVAVAYNGLAPGKDAPKGFWDDRDKRRPFMIHAEVNALTRCKKGEGEILACTLLPCSGCAQAIAANGIKEVVYLEVYSRDKQAIEIFEFYGVKLTHLKTV